MRHAMSHVRAARKRGPQKRTSFSGAVVGFARHVDLELQCVIAVALKDTDIAARPPEKVTVSGTFELV